MFPNYGYGQVPGQPTPQQPSILTADGSIIAQIQNIASLMNQQGMITTPTTVIPNNGTFAGPVPTQIIYNVPPNTVIPQMYPYIQSSVPGLAPAPTQYVIQPPIATLGQQFPAPINQITLPEGYNFIPAGSSLPNQLILAPAPIQQQAPTMFSNMFIPQFTEQQLQVFQTASNMANNNIMLNQLTTPMVVNQAPPPEPVEDIVFPNNPPRRKRKSTSKQKKSTASEGESSAQSSHPVQVKVEIPIQSAQPSQIKAEMPVQSAQSVRTNVEMPKLDPPRPVLVIPKREVEAVVSQSVNLTPMTPITPPPLLFRHDDSRDEADHGSSNPPLLGRNDRLESMPPFLGREDDEMEDLSDNSEPPVLSLPEEEVATETVEASGTLEPEETNVMPDLGPSTSTVASAPSCQASADESSKSATDVDSLSDSVPSTLTPSCVPTNSVPASIPPTSAPIPVLTSSTSASDPPKLPSNSVPVSISHATPSSSNSTTTSSTIVLKPVKLEPPSDPADCVPSTSVSNPTTATSTTSKSKTKKFVPATPSVSKPPVKLLSQLKLEVSPPPSPSSTIVEPRTRSSSPKEAYVPVDLYPDMPSPKSREKDFIEQNVRELLNRYFPNKQKPPPPPPPTPRITGNYGISKKELERMKRQMQRVEERRELRKRQKELKQLAKEKRLKTLEGKKPLVVKEVECRPPSPATLKMIEELASAGLLQSVKVKADPDKEDEVLLIEDKDFQFSKPKDDKDKRSKVPPVAKAATVAKRVKEHTKSVPVKKVQPKVVEKPRVKIAAEDTIKLELMNNRKLETEFEKCPGMDTPGFIQIMQEIGPIIHSCYPANNVVIKGVNATVHNCGTFHKVMYDGFTDIIDSYWPMFNAAAILTEKETGKVVHGSRPKVDEWIQKVAKEVSNSKTIELTGDNCLRAHRITVVHKESRAQLAVVFNSDVCIKRTFLIKSYCQIDPRIAAMTRLLSNYITKNHQLYQWTTTPICYLVIAFMLRCNYVRNLHEIDHRFIQGVNVLSMGAVPDDIVTATINDNKQHDSLAFLLYHFADFCYCLDFSKVVLDITKRPPIVRREPDDKPVFISCNYSGTNLGAQLRTKSVISFKRHMEYIMKSFRIGNASELFAYPFKLS
uniref:FCS-type domain-containing protein n=1 Tax=Panagrellus redivivus TaxID=6233 RepID=A0A7E4W9N8_PANRE